MESTVPGHVTERADFLEFIDQFDTVAVWSGTESGFDYTSPAFEEIYGRPVESGSEGISTVMERCHPEDRDRVLTAMADRNDRLRKGEPIVVEHRVIRPDGDRRWVEVRILPVHRDSGTLSEVGMTIDITDRKRAELELERLERFARTVSHDLRNPLTTSKGYLELVKEELDHPYLDCIEQGLSRMERIIADVSALAAIEKAAVAAELVDLEAEARTAWMSVSSERSTLTETNELGTVVADASLVRQLFEYAFRSAIERNDRAVTVRVGSLCENDGFYVADDGASIPEADRERVFEPEYVPSRNGTGFGFLIIDEIVDAHGWDVRLLDSTDGGVRLEVTHAPTA